MDATLKPGDTAGVIGDYTVQYQPDEDPENPWEVLDCDMIIDSNHPSEAEAREAAASYAKEDEEWERQELREEIAELMDEETDATILEQVKALLTASQAERRRRDALAGAILGRD